jgi:hypothetical protein
MERAHPKTIKISGESREKCWSEGNGRQPRGKGHDSDFGCAYVAYHIGYDERRGCAAARKPLPSSLDRLRDVVEAVQIPVQAVGVFLSCKR